MWPARSVPTKPDIRVGPRERRFTLLPGGVATRRDNPGSLIFSGVMLLEHLGWKEAADLIITAYERVVDRRVVTYDFARLMSGATEVSTSGFADALIDELRKLAPDATPPVTLPATVKLEKVARVAREPTADAPLAAAPAGVPPDALSWVYRLTAERAENQVTGR